MSGANNNVVVISSDMTTPLESIIIHNNNNEKNHQHAMKKANDIEQSRKNSFDLPTIVCNALNIPLFDESSFHDLVCQTLLVRNSTTTATTNHNNYNDGQKESIVPGMYAYHHHHHSAMQMMMQSPNIRATRLAMTLGLYHVRFYGTVVLVQEEASISSTSLLIDDVAMACNVSPDLRSCILMELLQSGCNNNDNVPTTALVQMSVPDWIANAAMNSYHDEDAISQLAAVMKKSRILEKQEENYDKDDSDDEEEDSTNNNSHDQEKPVHYNHREASSSIRSENDDDGGGDGNVTDDDRMAFSLREFVAKSPLCFHCRRPAELSPCPDCHAVYFCNLPRNCRSECWSHDCQCATWRLYERRRTVLSTLPLGDWHSELMGRDFQLSPLPYEEFLVKKLQFIVNNNKEQHDDETSSIKSTSSSWWLTELDHGWSGGQSAGAKTVDVEKRCSFQQGFYPIVDIPPDRPVSGEELEQCSSYCCITRNPVGWLCLSSWRDYYTLRGIPESSPVALLLTFPLTLYYGIAEHGQVPCTVARMLKRPLRIHVVGVEKELKLLDLFKEVAYLMPSDFSLELVFIVRDDMLPESLKIEKQKDNSSKGIVVKLCDNLCIYIVSGTYGESIDPNFDCGTGAPDIVMAFNAGLYAYKSWRSVIRFLDVHRGVVGIFTDYNEYSGLGCASLGGAKSRESLCVNPFRQPRAMPVYSMNLPQFSNGFLYVYNQQQELED